MLIGDVIKLTTVEERIVKFIAIKRQQNKEITGIDGKGQANNKKGIRNNKLGFAGEFLFCKSFNLFSDFTINNTSKIKKTDNGDAILKGYTVDVKTSQNKKYLMTPSYSKSNIDLFAKFYLDNKGKFIFQGFATNKMLFNIENLQKEKEKNYLLVDSYVLETSKLLNFKDIINQNQKTNKMSELKITGNITKVLELQKGVSKATGKEWQLSLIHI